MKKYIDGLQGRIEGQLLTYLASPGTSKADTEQLIGATMFQFCMFYDEANSRITQALKTIKAIRPS